MTIRDAVAALGDMVAPRCCIVCGRTLNLRERHICLCCEAGLPLTGFWKMEHNPMADRFNARIAEQLPEDGSRRYSRAVSYIFYNGDSDFKNIAWHLKYQGGITAGKYFAARFGALLASSELFSSVDTVIPVPLHWTRRFRRGYNQSEVLARGIAASLGASLENGALQRVRITRTQTKVALGGKESNVRGAFSLRSVPVGRHLLLVDDTFTTGATLCECYRALAEAVPTECRISVATLACVSDWL